MMYTIIKLNNGRFSCLGRLQDGTERWEEPSLEAAIKSMKAFARTTNATKIKKKDITYLQEVNVTQLRCVPWAPF